MSSYGTVQPFDFVSALHLMFVESRSQNCQLVSLLERGGKGECGSALSRSEEGKAARIYFDPGRTPRQRREAAAALALSMGEEKREARSLNRSGRVNIFEGTRTPLSLSRRSKAQQHHKAQK